MKLWHQLYGLMQSFQKNSWVVENEESQGPVIRKDFSYFGDYTQDVMVTISKKGAIVTRKLCTTKKDESVYAGLGYFEKHRDAYKKTGWQQDEFLIKRFDNGRLEIVDLPYYIIDGLDLAAVLQSFYLYEKIMEVPHLQNKSPESSGGT